MLSYFFFFSLLAFFVRLKEVVTYLNTLIGQGLVKSVADITAQDEQMLTEGNSYYGTWKKKRMLYDQELQQSCDPNAAPPGPQNDGIGVGVGGNSNVGNVVGGNSYQLALGGQGGGVVGGNSNVQMGPGNGNPGMNSLAGNLQVFNQFALQNQGGRLRTAVNLRNQMGRGMGAQVIRNMINQNRRGNMGVSNQGNIQQIGNSQQQIGNSNQQIGNSNQQIGNNQNNQLAYVPQGGSNVQQQQIGNSNQLAPRNTQFVSGRRNNSSRDRARHFNAFLKGRGGNKAFPIVNPNTVVGFNQFAVPNTNNQQSNL